MLPLEVLGKGAGVLETRAAGRSNEEDSSNGLLVQLLEDEVERLVRASNNDLFEEVLEELKDFELLELVLDALHVVKLL